MRWNERNLRVGPRTVMKSQQMLTQSFVRAGWKKEGCDKWDAFRDAKVMLSHHSRLAGLV